MPQTPQGTQKFHKFVGRPCLGENVFLSFVALSIFSPNVCLNLDTGKYEFRPLKVHPKLLPINTFNKPEFQTLICQGHGGVQMPCGPRRKHFDLSTLFTFPTRVHRSEAEDTKIAAWNRGVIGVICIKIRQRQHSNRFNSLTPPTRRPRKFHVSPCWESTGNTCEGLLKKLFMKTNVFEAINHRHHRRVGELQPYSSLIAPIFRNPFILGCSR